MLNHHLERGREREGEKRQERRWSGFGGRWAGGGAKGDRAALFQLRESDAALQSKMLPCEGIREPARRPGLDLRTLWKVGCNRSPFQVYACGSEPSLPIKPSLLQLTVLNPGALKQTPAAGRPSRPGWGLGGERWGRGVCRGYRWGWGGGSGSFVFSLIVGSPHKRQRNEMCKRGSVS